MRLVTFTAADESRIGVWQADGTVFIDPGLEGEVDDFGNLIMTRGDG